MSEPARNRFALDLDDLERQLRGAAQPQKPGSAVDPLVELTRIVGQDDPLKDLFAPRQAEQPRPVAVAAVPPQRYQERVEPSFQAVQPVQAAQPVYVPEAAAPPAELRGALDEFEALLRRTEPTRQAAQQSSAVPQRAFVPEPEPDYDDRYDPPQSYAPAAQSGPRDLDEAAAAQGYADGYGNDYDQTEAGDHHRQAVQPDEVREFEPRRSRKGLMVAAAVLGVVVVGAGATMALRGGRGADGGQPPMIAADTGPSKVAPANPGGAEIPNQNKQIYERTGDIATDKTKVVSREEQPIDVQQAARTMAPRVVMAGPGTATATVPDSAPSAAAEQGLVATPAVPGLGEPRRVRTVSIRPDGTPATTGSASAAAPGIMTGSVPPTSAQQPAPRPRPPLESDAPKSQERAATPTTPTTPAAKTRVAALGTAPTASTPAPAAAAAPRTDAAGGFVVQLAAPGSEAEAKATFAALQRKYPEQLGGQSPIVRKTDLAGGKTVYRLRVGPYSREDATTMCTRLQGAGGQCFIAKN